MLCFRGTKVRIFMLTRNNAIKKTPARDRKPPARTHISFSKIPRTYSSIKRWKKSSRSFSKPSNSRPDRIMVSSSTR